MDGTLLATDTLLEGFFRALFHRPRDAFAALLALRRGRAAVKAVLRAHSLAGVATYPVRPELLSWLATQASAGRELMLVTAADREVAEQVSKRFGIFSEVIATSDSRNLKGPAKRDELVRRFDAQWSYAGDSTCDLPLFARAQSAVLVGCGPKLVARVERFDKAIEARFPAPRATFGDWRRCLRLHQWAKNLLLFIPLLLSGAFVQGDRVGMVVLAFTLMGLCASGTYILNDLADLQADRLHPTKCDRPLASGRISLGQAFVAAIALVGLSITAAFFLKPVFGALLVIYTFVTLSYSLYFKRVPMLDVSLLSCLYTMRLLIGSVAASVRLSGWLAAFSLAFFLSLSLAKRQTELAKQKVAGGFSPGRGYKDSDASLVLAFGISSAMIALLLMILFLVFSAFRSGNYQDPKILISAPLFTFNWLSRIWLLASRGELEDDPVMFAVRDRQSLLLAFLMGGAALFAVIGWPFK